jgi:hypothetical protein
MTKTSVEERASPQEEDKARMLFGSRLMVKIFVFRIFSFILTYHNLQPGESSRAGSLKKSIFKSSK